MSVSPLEANDPLLQSLWDTPSTSTPAATSQNGQASDPASAAAGFFQDAYTLSLSSAALSLQASLGSASNPQSSNSDGSGNGATTSAEVLAALQAFLNPNTDTSSSNNSNPLFNDILNQNADDSSTNTGGDLSLNALLNQNSNISSDNNDEQVLNAFLDQGSDPSQTSFG